MWSPITRRWFVFGNFREQRRTSEQISGRTVNQLYQLLLRYYPPLLQLSAVPDEPWIWALLETAPAPALGTKLTVSRIGRQLAKHRIWRWTAPAIVEVLRVPPLPLADGTVEAVSEHALLPLPQLRLLSYRV